MAVSTANFRQSRHDMPICCGNAAQTIIVGRDKRQKAAHKRRTPHEA
jgi:hypothetical protein